MNSFLLSLFCSFIISVVAIPTIIKISYLKHLYDVPDDRKVHGRIIPTLGGLAIFAGFTISLSLFAPSGTEFFEYQYLYAALLLIFFIGLQDDILIISPLKKLLGQIIAAVFIVHLGGVQLTSLYGLFGIENIGHSYGQILTVFTLLVIMNGFNLIDGINWLSGGVGIIVSSAFGVFFLVNGFLEYAVISSALVGAILGFLWFNKTPAKIFMGDTGSLILGVINGVLCIHFIEVNNQATVLSFNSIPIVAFGIMIVPLFDTLRVFIWRMLKGKSPLNPDRNHIHHRLLELGFSHMKSSVIIMSVNLLFIGLIALIHNKINSVGLLFVLLFFAAILSYIPSIILKKRRAIAKSERLKIKKITKTPLSKVS